MCILKYKGYILKFKSVFHLIKSKLLIILISFGLLLFLSILTFLFYFGKNNLKSYDSIIRNSQQFCLEGDFFFPTLYTLGNPIPSTIEIKNEKKIFNKFTIYSNTICFLPTQLLPENREYTFTLTYLGQTGLNLFEKEILLTTDEYPEVVEVSFKEKINTSESLKYELEYENDFLDYYVVLDGTDQKSKCEREGKELSCNLGALNLEYGQKYDLSIIAMSGTNTVKEFNSLEIETLSAVEVISSSIKNGETINTLSIPKIVFGVNKEITETCTVSLSEIDGNQIQSTCSVNGTEVNVVPQSTFKQNTKYEFKLSNLVGLDGSIMNNEYTIQFSIGDGPRISSTNITSTNFSVTGNIELTFNQSISSTQNIKSFITFNSGTDYKYSISKNKVIINPNTNLSGCKQYSLSIRNGITSTTALVSTKTYTYALKTTCARVSSIGKSVQGRGIYANYYGTGSKKIIFYAAIHGSEANTSSTLRKWMKELELNYYKIPEDKTVIVITALNPDGVANKSRFNAHGVDINRNFQTSDWVSGTYFKDTYYPTGGGSAPFSEPETVAIRNFINSQRPYLTIAYHSAAGYVIPSGLAKSQEYGHIYSYLSGYRYITPGSEGSFSYDITGSFDDWGEQNGHNTLTIELSSAYVDEFEKNLSAMWRMVSL